MARLISVVAAGLLLMVSATAHCKDIRVEMKNSGKAGIMVFEPAFVRAQVGDVVHFVPTDPGHNAEAIPDITPPGVALLKGASGKEAVLRIQRPGLYGIKCAPHYSLGMVALVQAGPANAAFLAQARAAKLPPLAKKRMDADLAMVR